MAQKSQTRLEKELALEMKELAIEMRKLKSMEFVKFYKKPWKFVWYSFIKGVMVGLGTVLGASVLVAIVLYLFAQFSHVPLIGKFFQGLANQIQEPSTDNQ